MNCKKIILEKLENSNIVVKEFYENGKWFYSIEEEFELGDRIPNLILRVIGRDKQKAWEKFKELIGTRDVAIRIENIRKRGACMLAIKYVVE